MKTLRWTIALGALLALGACDDESEASTETETPAGEETAPAEERPLREVVGTTFEAIPEDATASIDRDKMLLGRRLYHDPALSGDGSISCATCHMLSHGGAEPRRSSTGIRGQIGPINSPTVLNSVYNFRQFWDGRAADLAEQAAGPVSNPIEMGGDWPVILERLQEDDEYPAAFTAAYGEEGITQENVIDAIVQYESYLVTPSPFDRWLRGDDDALTEQQQRGLRAFMTTGCQACHSGRNLGGASYQKLGAVHDYFERRGGRMTEADHGRFNVTQEEGDRHMFKVPTLRNVAVTGPYMHNGVFKDLRTTVLFYNRYNTKDPERLINPETGKPFRAPEVPATLSVKELTHGPALDDKRIDALVAFMKTLTDRRYEALLEK